MLVSHLDFFTKNKYWLELYTYVLQETLNLNESVFRCLREEMEKWLRLALEWDPKKRGRSQADELIIFSQLTNLLQKKV